MLVIEGKGDRRRRRWFNHGDRAGPAALWLQGKDHALRIEDSARILITEGTGLADR